MPLARAIRVWIKPLIRNSIPAFTALVLMAGNGCAKVQRRFIYFPPAHSRQEAESAARAADLQCWRTLSGNAIGWKRMFRSQPARGQVLILHGNASCAFNCAGYAAVLQKVAPLDVFMVEYPGYADRHGKPSEQALYAAAEEALEALQDGQPIYLVGESLGGALAAYLAGKHQDRIAGIVLLGPFNCLADVAQAHIRILPAKWILTERFPSEEYLRNYDGPVAILAAGRDRVVPAQFAQRLYDSYSGPKKLWHFSHATHDSLMDQPQEIWQEIVAFWQTYSPGSGK